MKEIVVSDHDIQMYEELLKMKKEGEENIKDIKKNP